MHHYVECGNIATDGYDYDTKEKQIYNHFVGLPAPSPAPRRRLGSPAEYLAVKPFIPEPADIEPVVEV